MQTQISAMTYIVAEGSIEAVSRYLSDVTPIIASDSGIEHIWKATGCKVQRHACLIAIEDDGELLAWTIGRLASGNLTNGETFETEDAARVQMQWLAHRDDWRV